MGNNFKYTLQKHKSKILIGSSIFLFCGVGAGTYALFNHPHLFGNEQVIQSKSVLAPYIVSGKKSGTITLMDTKKGKAVDSLSLQSGSYLFSTNQGLDTVYTYDGNTVHAYGFDGGKITDHGKIAQLKVEGATAFKVDGKNVAILSGNGQTLTYQYQVKNKTQTKVFQTQDSIKQFSLSNGILAYSTNTTLHSFSGTDEKVIDLGDNTDTITSFQNQLLIHNQFGSGLDDSVLMTLQEKDLKITNLVKTQSANTNLIPTDLGDASFYTTQYVAATEPYNLLDEWQIQNGQIVKNEDMEVKIPVSKDGIVYDQDTSVGSKGYLYTHYKDREQIFDVRSHEKLDDVPVSQDFAMPVLPNQ